MQVCGHRVRGAGRLLWRTALRRIALLAYGALATLWIRARCAAGGQDDCYDGYQNHRQCSRPDDDQDLVTALRLLRRGPRRPRAVRATRAAIRARLGPSGPSSSLLIWSEGAEGVAR